jgi:hypothetical protein
MRPALCYLDKKSGGGNASVHAGFRWRIYVLKRDGTDQKRLTHTAVDDLYPRWSPPT